MQATSEISKLKREISVLAEIIGRPRPALTPGEKRALKSDIERCIQELDELRNRLGG